MSALDAMKIEPLKRRPPDEVMTLEQFLVGVERVWVLLQAKGFCASGTMRVEVITHGEGVTAWLAGEPGTERTAGTIVSLDADEEGKRWGNTWERGNVEITRK